MVNPASTASWRVVVGKALKGYQGPPHGDASGEREESEQMICCLTGRRRMVRRWGREL